MRQKRSTRKPPRKAAPIDQLSPAVRDLYEALWQAEDNARATEAGQASKAVR